MLDLNEEKNLFARGYKVIAGIDEVGRGPLAGPVVAAALVLSSKSPLHFGGQGITTDKLKEIKDSKKLAEKKREELYEVIREEFDEVGIGICDQGTIDKINILQAGFLAMKKAIGSLKNKPDFIMLDGKFLIPNCSYQQQAIIHGDNLVFSIAAASIIAKVTRDRIMKEMHEQYPQYCFDQHKGYGTKLHLEQLRAHGPCQIHRRSFGPVKRLLKHKNT